MALALSLQQYHAETMQSPDSSDRSRRKRKKEIFFFFFILAEYAVTISNVPTLNENPKLSHEITPCSKVIWGFDGGGENIGAEI